MKVIELLNKITSGYEVPKKIFYLDKIWYWDIKAQDYIEDDKRLFNYYIVDELMDSLNDEIEIIEEDKKIEKINLKGYTSCLGTDEEWTTSEEIIIAKVNEIIDYLNKEE